MVRQRPRELSGASGGRQGTERNGRTVTHHANVESTRSTEFRVPKACPASGPLNLSGATARQGGVSQYGPFPGPSASGAFPDPKAGAAANFATPAVRVSFPGMRARNEQRGRSIQCRGFSHPQAWAARACSSLSSHRAFSSAQRPADRHVRDSAPARGLRQMDRRDPELAMLPNRNLPPVGATRSVGLIDQEIQSDGDGFPIRLASTRPTGPVPVGVTQGERD
jgi:hypothetical protein